MEFKKELMATLYENTLQNNLFYSPEEFIEDLNNYYDVESTNNGWIINDYGEETYISRQEIEKIIEEAVDDRMREVQWRENQSITANLQKI